MRTASTRRWAGAAAFVALLLSVVAAWVATTPAHARLVSVDMSFLEMLPGEQRSNSAEVFLPRDARLANVALAHESSASNAFDWTVELCRGGGECLPVSPASAGAELAAGAYVVVTTVALASDAPAAALSAITGELVLEGGGADLPLTGVSLGVLVLVAALLAIGVALLVIAHRAPREGSDSA